MKKFTHCNEVIQKAANNKSHCGEILRKKADRPYSGHPLSFIIQVMTLFISLACFLLIGCSSLIPQKPTMLKPPPEEVEFVFGESTFDKKIASVAGPLEVYGYYGCCPECKSTVSYQATTCDSCEKDLKWVVKNMKCYRCFGTGSVECKYCNKTRKCTKCKGTGRCYGSAGESQCNGCMTCSHTRKCFYCAGSGKCYFCQGLDKCPDCNGAGEVMVGDTPYPDEEASESSYEGFRPIEIDKDKEKQK